MGANILNNTYLTIGHIILKSKKENDHTNALKLFLSQMADSFHNLSVKYIISDFEKALLNSIKDTISFFI